MNASITSSGDATLRAGSTVYSRATVLWSLAIFTAWAAMVTVGELYHEFWRDEVRALSLALEAPSLAAVPAVIHGEGHPALWYLLLRTSYDLFGTRAVLPALSVLIAAAAVVIFLWKAPFPLWFKALFVLSAIPIYEYSVMARNYGISMLLMFVYAVVYTSPKRSPVWGGSVLFLLSQTNVIANLLIPFYLLIWLADWWSARKSSSVPPDGFGRIVFVGLAGSAGMLAAFATVYPTAHDLMTLTPPDSIGILRGVGSAILLPGQFYCGFSVLTSTALCSTGGRLAEVATSYLLYAMVAGLAIRLPLMLSALGSLWATTVFFQFVYPGGYRHQGIWLVFVITLYWFALASQRDTVQRTPGSLKAQLFSMCFYGVIPVALAMHTGITQIYLEVTTEMSKSQAIGNLLSASPDLHDAIIVAEPEHIAEAIPYYANNEIYLLREGKFGKFATWSARSSKLELTLQDVLSTARNLKAETGRPILILLEYPVTAIGPQQTREFASTVTKMWRFSYNEEEAKTFLAATQKIPLGPPASLENFDAYLLR